MTQAYLPTFDPRDAGDLGAQGARLSVDQRAILWSLARQLETADARVFLNANDALSMAFGDVEVLVPNQVLDAGAARALAGGRWPGEGDPS